MLQLWKLHSPCTICFLSIWPQLVILATAIQCFTYYSQLTPTSGYISNGYPVLAIHRLYPPQVEFVALLTLILWVSRMLSHNKDTQRKLAPEQRVIKCSQQSRFHPTQYIVATYFVISVTHTFRIAAVLFINHIVILSTYKDILLHEW